MLRTAERDIPQARFDPLDFPPGDDRPFELLYRGLRRPYMAWALRHWSAPDALLEEAFHEAMLIFRRKAWDGGLEGYRGKQFNTILFSFAANLIRNRLRQEQQHHSRFLPLEPELAEMEPESEEMVRRESGEGIFSEGAVGKAARLRVGFEQLTGRCRELLLLRIVHGLSMPEIAQQLGFSGTDSAKTAKNKCQNRLKQLLGIDKDDKS